MTATTPDTYGEDRHLCVTCGEIKDSDAFHVGDCTCKECNDAGRGAVNYRLQNGEIVENTAK